MSVLSGQYTKMVSYFIRWFAEVERKTEKLQQQQQLKYRGTKTETLVCEYDKATESLSGINHVDDDDNM